MNFPTVSDPTGNIGTASREVQPRNGTIPRFENAGATSASPLPSALEKQFRSDYWNASAEIGSTFDQALAALTSSWLWLVNSGDVEARSLRAGIAKRANLDGGYAVGTDVKRSSGDDLGAAEGISRNTYATSSPSSTLARLERRDVELLEGLRSHQGYVQAAAKESDAIRRLRQIIAADNLEEVLILVKLISL